MSIAAKQISLKEYFAAGPFYTDKDAQIIGPVLEDLAVQGRSTPKQIVEAASDPKSPLHNYFEWRDDVAAQRFREQQARIMTASIVVKIADNDGEERQVRAFHSARIVPIDTSEFKRGFKQHPYVTVDQVRESKELADSVIQEALSQLISWKKKYATYRALFKEFEQLNSIFDAINSLEGQANV